MLNRKALLTLAGLALGLVTRCFAIQPETDKHIMAGLDAAYSMDFDRAAELFSEADRLEPGHPAGPFFLASLQWFKYSQNVDVPKTAGEFEPRFNQLINQALDRAHKMYAKNHDDPEANFYLGAVYGMKGRWLMLQRRWIRAAHYGYKGYKYFMKTIDLDPEYYDAYLGLGMYDYYSDTLPTVLKFTARLIARGDKKRGLRYIETTLQKGHYSVTEAKLFMISILVGYEKKPEQALSLIFDLRRERPANLFFILMEMPARMVARDWDGAAAFGEYLATRVRETASAKPHVSLFDLYLGEAYLGAKDNARALAIFNRCIDQAPEPQKASVTFCHLRRAQLFDLLGRRDDALEDYSFVKKRPDFFDSQDKAALGLKEQITYEDVVKQLQE